MTRPRGVIPTDLMTQIITQLAEAAKDITSLTAAVKQLSEQVSAISAATQVQQTLTANLDQRLIALTQRLNGVEERERAAANVQQERLVQAGNLQRNWLLTYASIAIGAGGLLLALVSYLGQHWR